MKKLESLLPNDIDIERSKRHEAARGRKSNMNKQRKELRLLL